MYPNDPANDVPNINEEAIIDTRDDLFYELHTTGDVIIFGKKVSIFDLIEELDNEDMNNVFSMLVMGSEDAKEFALEKLMEIFKIQISDEDIEEHYVDDKESY